MNIEDVFPSRLKKIFDVKGEIEKRKVYRNVKIYKGKVQVDSGLTFTFRTIKEFVSQKEFLEIINSIFIGKSINYNYLLESFLEIILPKLNNNESCYYNIRNSFISLEIINKLGLLNKRIDGEVKKVIEKTEKNKMYLNFFEEHIENFDTDLRRGIFLQGIMVQKLLNLPEQQGSKAFYSRLNSLKMNEKIIKRIYSEVIDKLIQYKKRHYYLELEKLIGSYFVSADFKGMSRDEMSYYFVLGMNLAGEFKSIEGENNEKLS
jgi:CRISPR-associated protein Csh1